MARSHRLNVRLQRVGRVDPSTTFREYAKCAIGLCRDRSVAPETIKRAHILDSLNFRVSLHVSLFIVNQQLSEAKLEHLTKYKISDV